MEIHDLVIIRAADLRARDRRFESQTGRCAVSERKITAAPRTSADSFATTSSHSFPLHLAAHLCDGLMSIQAGDLYADEARKLNRWVWQGSGRTMAQHTQCRCEVLSKCSTISAHFSSLRTRQLDRREVMWLKALYT